MKETPERLSIEEWLQEREDNLVRIARTKDGADRDGYLEDATYYRRTLQRMAELEAKIQSEIDLRDREWHEQQARITALTKQIERLK